MSADRDDAPVDDDDPSRSVSADEDAATRDDTSGDASQASDATLPIDLPDAGPRPLRLGTRGSDLALWQANWVKAQLAPELDVELVVLQTTGDLKRDRPLQQEEGAAFFTAEIERALAEGEVDLAVHSHKDMETEAPPGLVVAAVPPRGPTQERLLVHPDAYDDAAAFLPLKADASVGTSAPRRRAQLKALRPDLELADLRGNVPTRVQRCRDGKLDAVLLAAAGLERLELDIGDLIAVDLDPAFFVPAPAQGALGIQVRASDTELHETLERLLHHSRTDEAIAAERTVLTRLGGGCHLPAGALLSHDDDAPAAKAWTARLFLGPGLAGDGALACWASASANTIERALHDAWERAAGDDATGQGPLGGVSVVLAGSSAGPTSLGDRLAALGATVTHEKILAFRDVKAPDLPAKLARLKPGDVIAVTSQEAARRLDGDDVPSGVSVAAVGPATARALGAAGLKPDLVGKGGARHLAERIEVREGGKVLFPCAEDSRPELPRSLAARGIEVVKVVLYKTVSEGVTEPTAGVDVRVYMSPSAVSSSVALDREQGGREGPLRIGIGGSTCDALQDEGLEHERPGGSGPEATVALLGRLVADGRLPRPHADEPDDSEESPS